MATRNGRGGSRRQATSIAALRRRTTITVVEAAEVLGLSRGSAFAAASRGDLPTLRIGRRLVVPVPALLKMLGDKG